NRGEIGVRHRCYSGLGCLQCRRVCRWLICLLLTAAVNAITLRTRSTNQLPLWHTQRRTNPSPVQAYCAAHGDRPLRAASLFRPEQSQRKPAQIEKIANHSHENETPEPFFEGLCF